MADTAIYPDEETIGRLYSTTPKDQRTQRVLTRTWTKVVQPVSDRRAPPPGPAKDRGFSTTARVSHGMRKVARES